MWRGSMVAWPVFNAAFDGSFGIGCVNSGNLTIAGSRSKYMPHIGKKERGRYAAA